MSYFINMFRTGAVRKTPKKIIQKIIEQVEYKPGMTVIELGAGKGEITQKILEKSGEDPKINYYAFEIDKKFANILRDSFPGIRVITEDALNFDQFIRMGKADYVISSLPLSFYSRKRIKEVMQKMKSTTQGQGRIIILYHAFWISGLMRNILGKTKLFRFLTLPPYYLLVSE